MSEIVISSWSFDSFTSCIEMNGKLIDELPGKKSAFVSYTRIRLYPKFLHYNM